MKKFFRPSSLILYLLTTLVFLLTGILYAVLTEAAKGQGLAGGAIVLGYGVMFAMIALVVSIFTAMYVTRSVVVKINYVLAMILIVAAVIISFRLMAQNWEHTTGSDRVLRQTSMVL